MGPIPTNIQPSWSLKKILLNLVAKVVIVFETNKRNSFARLAKLDYGFLDPHIHVEMLGDVVLFF